MAPKQWKIAEIMCIFKEGDKTNLKNYRPISFISNVAKIFTAMMKERISNTLDSWQLVKQADFRKNYSIVDHIFTLNQIMEKPIEYSL